jgi:ribosome recycling factor
VVKDVLDETEQRMSRQVEVFQRELAGMRVGRAHPALLDKVVVDYYGAPTPLNHLGQVNVPEPRSLAVQPYDKSAVGAIERAIQKADLGLGIRVDGDVIRLSVPPLTEERRRDLVRQLKRQVEDQRVVMRNIRRDAQDTFRDLEKEKAISEDEHRRAVDQLQKLTDRFIHALDELGETQERELLQP